MSDSAKLVLLSGEAGIGKIRLAFCEVLTVLAQNVIGEGKREAYFPKKR
jgi:predicted ribonuclease YlaK